MFDQLFRKEIFPNRPSFHLALAVFTFNLIVLSLFALLSLLFGLENPVTKVKTTATIDDVRALLALCGFWAIGNCLLLLGLVDAMKPTPQT